jgi:hypothetical protein
METKIRIQSRWPALAIGSVPLLWFLLIACGTAAPAPTSLPTGTEAPTTMPIPTATPGLAPTPFSVTTNATAKQACNSDFSHELTVSWKVTGGRPSVTIEITGPDDKVETITDLPTEDTRTFQLRHPGGGLAKIEVVAKDASNSSSLAQSSVQLGKCSSGMNSVSGSGNLTSEPRTVSGFTAVSLSGSGHLILEQTGTEALTITAEDNILPYLTSEVSGTQLRLGPKSNTSLQTTQEITYRLTVKSLDALEVTGSGTVEAQGIKAERLQITVRGAGDLTMAGQATRQEISLAGAGNYRGEDLQSQAVTIDIAGSGNAVLAVSDTLEANVRGLGSVEYVGDPVVRQHVSGLGSVRKR